MLGVIWPHLLVVHNLAKREGWNLALGSRALESSAARLRIWTGRIWAVSGPRIPFCATGALWGRVAPFLDHFSKLLSSVLGRRDPADPAAGTLRGTFDRPL